MKVDSSPHINTLIHCLLAFFVGIAVGVAITYFGFEGNFSTYRKAEIKGQQLEVSRYLQVVENPKMSDAETREELKAFLKNRANSLIELEKHAD